MPLLTSGDVKRCIVTQFTANGTTPVVVNIPNLELTSLIITSLNTVGGTVAAVVQTTKVVGSAGTASFISAVGNTSIYDVVVFL